MPGTSPVILILGAGPNIGQAVARTFASKGYKVALAARSLREADSTDNQLNITSDFANPDDVVNAFTKVNRKISNVRQDFQQSPHAQSWHQVEIQKPHELPNQLTFVKQVIINLGSKSFANPTLPARRYLCRGTTKPRLSLS